MDTLFRTKSNPETETLPAFKTVNDVISAYGGDDHIQCFYPARIRAAAQSFLSGFPGQIIYAVKANPHPFVLKTLWHEGVKAFDVASTREITLITDMFEDAKLYLMHPVKSRQTIRFAYEKGVRDFAFDHSDELQKILDCTQDARDLHLHLRLSLPKGGAAMPLRGKFGAEFSAAKELLRRARAEAPRLGICFHVGSQCLDPGDYRAAIEYAADLVLKSGVRIDSLDIGGGFPVAYPGMNTAPLSVYFDEIKAALKRQNWDHLDLIGEPGRALCAEGGSTLARIELRKGRDLYLNDGTFGTLYDAGHFAWKFPVRLHRNRPPNPMQTQLEYRFFGPTCDSMDVMAGPFSLPADAAEGDWVEIQNLGAYGQALATNFNGFHSTDAVIIDTERF